MLEGGKYYKFVVDRKTDLGYMLKDKFAEVVLMFYKEAVKEYEIGEEVSAFLYYDKQGRFCATTKEVYATTSKIGLLEVLSVSDNGVYLNNNTLKDILLSSDYLPKDKTLWPRINDKVFVILKLKKNSLVARLIKKSDINSDVDFIFNENVLAYVNEINEKGILAYSEGMSPIFIPKMFIRENINIGKAIKCHITKILSDISYGSMLLNKEKQMVLDEDIILNYLKTYKKMPFTAKSSSIAIENTFNISRKAFKRAYGKLYKDGKIYFDEEYTYLKD